MSTKSLLIVASIVLVICAQSAVLAFNPPPTAVAVSPISGTAPVDQWKTFVCTYSDPSGSADIATCYFLINSGIRSSGGGYFYYNKVTNKLYMRNDAFAALGGVTPGTAGATIETENAILNCATTTITTGVNTVTVTWKMKFKPSMQGKNYNLYMQVSDKAANVSGWSDKGDVTVNAPPSVMNVSPTSGTAPVGLWRTFVCTYYDSNGSADVANCYFLINSSITSAGGAYVYFNRGSNKLYMRNNAYTALGGIAPGTPGETIETENAILDCAATSVSTGVNTLTVYWKIQFKPAMQGKNFNLYAQASDLWGGQSGWVDKGDVTVNAPPTVMSVSPSSGTAPTNVWKTIVCTYSDSNGSADIAHCYLNVNTNPTSVGGAYLYYNRLTGNLYMRDDAFNLYGGHVPGTPGATIETPNAVLDCAATTITAGVNAVTIAWKVKFKSPMQGKNCNTYAQVIDKWSGQSGWVDKGDLIINAPPAVVSVSPAVEMVTPDEWTTLVCTYTDPNGSADIAHCYFVVNDTTSSVGGGYFYYNALTDCLYMRDNLFNMQGGHIPGTPGTIAETENAVLDCAATTVTRGANTLTVAWRVKFKATMWGGARHMFARGIDKWGGDSGWTDEGYLTVNTPPTAVSVSPNSGTVPPGSWQTFTCTYSDVDGADDMYQFYLIVNEVISDEGAAQFLYYEPTNDLYMVDSDGEIVGEVDLGTAGATIETDTAILDCANTTVTVSGNNVVIAWRVQFKPVMQGMNANLYMVAVDFGGGYTGWVDRGDITIGTPGLADLIAMGKARINSLATMEPYDPDTARLLLEEAYGFFEDAKALSANNADANFGLAMTDAALTAQDMIDKYQDEFDDGNTELGALKYAVGALQVMDISNLVAPGKEPLGGLITAYKDSIAGAYATTEDGQLILEIQADIRDVIRPMLSRVAGYLQIVETYGGASFAFPIGTPSWDGYKIIDVGDVYIFHGGLLAARWALAIPVSYNVDAGSFDFDTDANLLDTNHDGLLPPSEYMPPNPFGSLTSSATMTGAKADMSTACDKIIAGIDATLAETTDNYDLISWHTPDEGPTQAELLEIRSFASNAKLALNTAKTFSWEDSEGTQSIKVYLGAWNNNPPSNLKSFFPTQEVIRWRNDWAGRYEYDMEIADNGFPDMTFGGLFPDGAPEFDYETKLTFETGFNGSLSGFTTYPANGATNVSTETHQFSMTFTSYPPAVVSFRLQRSFAGAWRNEPIGHDVWFNGDDTVYLWLGESLWPNTTYRMVFTNEVAHTSVTRTFTTGADAPF